MEGQDISANNRQLPPIINRADDFFSRIEAVSDPAGYTVGWICALPVEYIAAQEFLDEEHDKPSFVSPNDANDYTLGSIGEHNVVIAVLPDGEHGTASAASVATNMLNSFQNIRIGLMVGIGGGVPSESHDIRLGDVVVSAPRGGESGHQLEEAVNGVFEKNMKLRRRYKRPEPSTDRLFLPEPIHHQAGCAVCAGDPFKLVLRSEQADDQDNPAIHYGLIASGNQLMKDAVIRDRLATEKDILCFEMEAAGLMNTFPCLIIRGICDYSDSHKNKEWQGYAAMVAATYTKDLLWRIPLNRFEAEERISAVMSSITQRSSKASNIAWSKHTVKMNGTLVSADPGCGKSVLARSIIDDYSETSHPTVRICYFFFKDNDEQNNLTTALCSVLHQLFSQQSDLLTYAIPTWERNGDALRQEVDELWRIFMAATSANISRKTICIFDALDEYRETDQRRLVKKLQTFYLQPSSSTEQTCLKFLVTSRPYDHIQDHFRAITDSFPHIHIKGEEQNDQIHEEIDLVVRTRVRELAETVPLSLELHHRIKQQLLRMEHRTYLWLHLAIDDVRNTFKDSLRPTKTLITLIPPSVDAAYGKLLCRVPANLMITVKTILEIIVAARRPLTMREMAMALGIATVSGSPTAKQTALDLIGLDDKLRRWCGLFVFTNKSKLYLTHQTAREFLIKKNNSSNPNSTYWNSLAHAEDQMAKICLSYLLMEGLEYDEGESGSLTGSFLEYSAAHWPDHVRIMSLTSSEKETERVYLLYNITGKSFSMWFPIFWKVFGPHETTPVMSALHLVAFNGHEQEIHAILSVDKSDINKPDGMNTYPVIWASLNGYDTIVELLLEQGADVNAQGGHYGNALRAACFGDYDNIAKMLIEHGADVNAQGGPYGNALRVACSKGNATIAQILVKHGADVNAQSEHYGNALQAACSEGHATIAHMLLERGADVNAQGGPYGNALQAACSEGHATIAQILIEHGADVNAQGGPYRNALQVACLGGYDNIAKILVEHGADINAQGGPYGNALQAACSNGNATIAQILVKHGADINAQDKHYGNALQAACFGGYDNIAKMLIEHGADVNAQGGPYGSALEIACSKGDEKITRMLVEHRLGINAQGGHIGNAS
ncbi:hypothetical protein PENCOP_c018G00646 [Penicillium coprophilum]|uniref:Uncharacterized protein n=1 Tax=Penicillium coprophilum TaxID=36646 RepID=A0A1V6U955_9EURO|nr:hypothetical protein PENCOP_c018G00646 [Penicillium coprophilum]